jgi:hypothetical protein
MRNCASYVATAAALSALLWLSSMPAAAQNKAATGKPVGPNTNEELQKVYLELPVSKLPTPRAADGHPELSGFWNNGFAGVSLTGADGVYGFLLGPKRDPNAPLPKYPEPTEPVYKPQFAARVKEIIDGQVGPTTPLDPEMDCKPLGVPRAAAGPLQIVQNPKFVAILYESNFIGQTFRIIYTDGRPHPKDLDSSFLGDSIGHWEGDTLLVDVVGLNDETWLGGAQGHTEPPAYGQAGGHQIIEKYALIHSDQEHVMERYTRHGNMLIYEATVEDPVMFTKPWVLTPRHLLHGGPDDRLFESFCNNHDKSHLVTPAKIDP